MEPLPAAAADLSCDIAEKELLRSLMDRDALLEPLALAEAPADAEVLAAGAELLLELLELLQPAATSTAAAAAAASPALADTEYNGVPRSFAQTCHELACARTDPYEPVRKDRAIRRNARTVRRNVPVNTFI
jgi:hypothetical protein